MTTSTLVKREDDILSSPVSAQHIPSVDECNSMSAAVLHRNLEASLVGTIVCYTAAKNLIVSAKIRMQGGEKIGGCLTFLGEGGYVDTYIRKHHQNLDAAVRAAYRLLDGLGIDEKHNGSHARKAKAKKNNDAKKKAANEKKTKVTEGSESSCLELCHFYDRLLEGFVIPTKAEDLQALFDGGDPDDIVPRIEKVEDGYKLDFSGWVLHAETIAALARLFNPPISARHES
jgi:hypothetical protein